MEVNDEYFGFKDFVHLSGADCIYIILSFMFLFVC